MTTPRTLARTAEGRTIIATTRWNPADTIWEPAARLAMHRRTTRDAVLILLAHNNNWTRARNALTTIRPTGPTTINNNIATLIGITHWIDGNTTTATQTLPPPGTHPMSDTIRRMINHGTTAEHWTTTLTNIDIIECLTYRHRPPVPHSPDLPGRNSP